MKITFFWRNAGLVSFMSDGVCVHLFPSYRHWVWLRDTEDYDMCLEYFGLGPLLLVAWLPK